MALSSRSKSAASALNSSVEVSLVAALLAVVAAWVDKALVATSSHADEEDPFGAVEVLPKRRERHDYRSRTSSPFPTSLSRFRCN
jgi:hypothetical protein